MSCPTESAFGLLVPHGKLDQCIEFLEGGLEAISQTPYHAMLGRDLLHHKDGAARYLIDFYRQASAQIAVASLYFEMNGFTINPDLWWFSGFGYKEAGDIWNPEWLAYWDAETEHFFPITGLEPVQEAFGTLYPADPDQPLGIKLAAEVAEYLVTARYMQLIAVSHRVAKEEVPELNGLPVIATAHDWDTFHESK